MEGHAGRSKLVNETYVALTYNNSVLTCFQRSPIAVPGHMGFRVLHGGMARQPRGRPPATPMPMHHQWPCMHPQLEFERRP